MVAPNLLEPGYLDTGHLLVNLGFPIFRFPMGSNGMQWGPMGSKKLKKWAKSEKPKTQETLHKRSLGLIKMGFW